MNKEVMEWVREAPFDDPSAMQRKPDFSYEDWFARGRSLPEAVETLVETLKREDLAHPSGDGMRLAYALGWIGDRRKEIVDVLLRSLGSHDVRLRMEAAAALGRQGDAAVLPVLQRLLADTKDDVNVRANACVAIGRIGSPSSEASLEAVRADKDPFLASCAEEALRLLRGEK